MQANWQLPAEITLAATSFAQDPTRREREHAPKRQAKVGFDYRLIYGVCFCLFLWIGLLGRINPMQWLRPAGGPERRSMLSEARAEAHYCATMSFQG